MNPEELENREGSVNPQGVTEPGEVPGPRLAPPPSELSGGAPDCSAQQPIRTRHREASSQWGARSGPGRAEAAAAVLRERGGRSGQVRMGGSVRGFSGSVLSSRSWFRLLSLQHGSSEPRRGVWASSERRWRVWAGPGSSREARVKRGGRTRSGWGRAPKSFPRLSLVTAPSLKELRMLWDTRSGTERGNVGCPVQGLELILVYPF